MREECITQSQAIWDEILNACPDNDYTREGRRHMTSVSAIAAGLSRLRGVDEGKARIAGLFHDITAYETGVRKDHAHLSAIRTREILSSAVRESDNEKETPLFSKEELDDICGAIYFHTDKARVDFPLAEVLKDADLLDRFLDDPDYDPGKKSAERLPRLRAELGDLQQAALRLRKPR